MSHRILFNSIVACVFGIVAAGCFQREPESVEVAPEMENLGGIVPEDAEEFTTFIDRFRSDTLFQLSRIAFPLTVEFFDGNYDDPGVNFTAIARSDWRFDPLDPPRGAEISVDRVTDTTTDFVMGGGMSRTYLRYRFRLVAAGWYLSRIADESD